MRFNTDLAGDPAAGQSRLMSERMVKTPWLEIDDVFFEARGSAWALLHILRAIEKILVQFLIIKMRVCRLNK